jgi:ubiquinone/menaquinone biosynthesis C-methylase UbiE
VCSTPQPIDLAAIKQRQQKAWASGDYPAIGAVLVVVSEVLCETADLRTGERVLDIATGSGNTALAAARRFCEVTAVDYVASMLERTRERAATERLPITVRDGDAEALPFEDGAFDVVLSTFGVMFAPDQERAAAELLRVCRPGGKIGLASWTIDGFSAAQLELMNRYMPPPPGLRPPHRWGTRAGLQELLGHGAELVQMNQRTFYFRHRTPESLEEFLRRNAGPQLKAFESLDPTRQELFVRERVELIRRFNRSGDETVVLPNEYLELIAIRR